MVRTWQKDCAGFKELVAVDLPLGKGDVGMKPGNAAVLIVGALSFLPLWQQQPTYSVKVAEVQIAAQVKDKNGRSIADLKKEDFILQEEGKSQEIEYFARQSDLPLTLGLLVDTSMSQRQVLPEERTASFQFFQQVLRPEKDKAFVISFDFEARLLEDLTSDMGRLDNSLRDIALPRTQPASGNRGRGGAEAEVQVRCCTMRPFSPRMRFSGRKPAAKPSFSYPTVSTTAALKSWSQLSKRYNGQTR